MISSETPSEKNCISRSSERLSKGNTASIGSRLLAGAWGTATVPGALALLSDHPSDASRAALARSLGHMPSTPIMDADDCKRLLMDLMQRDNLSGAESKELVALAKKNPVLSDPIYLNLSSASGAQVLNFDFAEAHDGARSFNAEREPLLRNGVTHIALGAKQTRQQDEQGVRDDGDKHERHVQRRTEHGGHAWAPTLLFLAAGSG